MCVKCIITIGIVSQVIHKQDMTSVSVITPPLVIRLHMFVAIHYIVLSSGLALYMRMTLPTMENFIINVT